MYYYIFNKNSIPSYIPFIYIASHNSLSAEFTRNILYICLLAMLMIKNLPQALRVSPTISLRRLPTAAIIRRTYFTSDVTGNLLDKFGEVGAKAEVRHIFHQEDVKHFASISGDNNPIHTDPEFASTTMFKGTIVHGIFVSSLFSTLFGRSIPGSIYVSQDLRFKKPVMVGAQVVASIEVLKVDDKGSKGLLMTCATRCRLEVSSDLVVDGEGKILVPKAIANQLLKLKSSLL